jgi:hypothetical protein
MGIEATRIEPSTKCCVKFHKTNEGIFSKHKRLFHNTIMFSGIWPVKVWIKPCHAMVISYRCRRTPVVTRDKEFIASLRRSEQPWFVCGTKIRDQ